MVWPGGFFCRPEKRVPFWGFSPDNWVHPGRDAEGCSSIGELIMKCPFCRVDNDKVIDSRTSEDGISIRRRRECQGCNKRFTTYERVAELDMRVVKKDGSRQPFSPDKIRRGLELACWKRPIPTEAVERIICEILQDIYLLGDEEIESDRIGEMVMERLFKVDQVAYIRFASVYREFKDVRDFVEEVQPFLHRNLKQRDRG